MPKRSPSPPLTRAYLDQALRRVEKRILKHIDDKTDGILEAISGINTEPLHHIQEAVVDVAVRVKADDLASVGRVQADLRTPASSAHP